ncbi:hypothetical protein ACGFNU_09020 [Spirillospora sp. NPDC048911]|uniref:hypothetical protein n=1 Tax=Spirillospora sp. NPDC048911 TaxID=3364527 RepID=UPI003718F29A
MPVPQPTREAPDVPAVPVADDEPVAVAEPANTRAGMRPGERRKRLAGATAGAAGVVGLAAGALSLMVLQPFSDERHRTLVPQSAGAARTPDTRFETPTSPPLLPDRKPGAAPSERPKAERTPPPAKPSAKPGKRKSGSAPPPDAKTGGALQVSDGSCRGIAAPIARRCTISLTAVGGAVRWSVAGIDPGIARMSAGGGGTLSGGQSTIVSVTIVPTVRCYARGFGTGTVSFAPGGSATVSYTCW